MAVINDSKEIKKKNNSSKKKTSSEKKKANTQKKKEVIKELPKEELVLNQSKESDDTELDKTVVISSEEIKELAKDDDKAEVIPTLDDISDNIVKRNNKKILYLLIPFALLILWIYLLFPKIRLDGDNEVTIAYNQVYKELGYKAKILFKDITNKIKVDSNLNTSKIGKYKINYYLEYGLFNINKSRIINVIDNIKPEIITEDIINVCPNQAVPEIEFKAIDEYDGDLTNKVIKNSFDDKIILSISDKSNNKTVKEVVIDREDRTPPEIKLNGSDTIYLGVGASYVEPGYIAQDNCDGDITDKVQVSGSVETYAGTYQLIYSVSDSSANKIEVTRTIIIRNYSLYNSGTIGNGVVYLTFDDGPNEGTTNVILDVLKEQGVKATFFVTCNGPDYLIKRMYDEGHTVALHTATHDYGYIYSSVDNYFNDLNRVSERVKNVIGVESKIIRFPGGSSNTTSRKYQLGIMTTLTGMVLDRGYRYFDWNVDAMDASTARSSSDVYYNVINNLSMNRANVVLMHDVKGITRDAIRNIIKTAQSQGYTFARIDMDTYMVRHGVKN